MSDYYYGWARGKPQNPQSIVVGTSTGSTDVELHVSTTHNVTKMDVILALRAIEQLINSNGIGTTTGAGVDLPAK